LTDAVIEDVVAVVPESWLQGEAAFADVPAHRRAYIDYLKRRRDARAAFVQEAMRAYAAHV